MVARVCLILLVLSTLKIPWVLEQPQSSILEYSEPFQNLAKHFKIFKAGFHVPQLLESCRGCCLLGTSSMDCQVFIWLGSYGGASPFPGRSSVLECSVGVDLAG